jgi:hypothetical protein
MAAFQVSITNPSTGLVDVTDQNDVLGIVDHSNYSDGTEPGHAQANFSQFRMIKLELPTGTTYLFSSLYPTHGDVALSVPNGSTLPLSTLYNYTSGDGKYVITLYALPTWSLTDPYQIAYAPYIWYNNKIYKCLQNSFNNIPSSSPTYWEDKGAFDIDTIDTILPTKYKLIQNIILSSDMKEVWARRVYNSLIANGIVGPVYENLFNDPEYIDALTLDLGIKALPVLLRLEAWDEVENIVNVSKQIRSKYSTY